MPTGDSARIVLTCCPHAGITATMNIYKIFRADEWAQLRRDKITKGAPIDIADGFVHFSAADQVQATADAHFAELDGLFLLSCDADAFGDALKWEVSRGGAKFPHLFRELRLEDVEWAQPLPLVDGRHQFPAGLL